ncbi:LETM1-related biofilm-associated protein [Flavobacterium sp. I-SCBP12n]|uniref:LETM1-related biofilm-associated protein n=1 Tax=Flavobacterium pygoscelis TaxID=2893176 RepID=A0A9X1XTY8_9FLAO|nr:LETM1-related biofilm-associated protein [Flavobacterium pygoscelis]MCK8141598.1 LETM1-related biofilm-associated protein [Flavobacterium pygoscelis]
MINPSASGWIDKFFVKQKFSEETISKNTDIFYTNVRNTGFIYGHIISFHTVEPIETKGWFKDEISKVALLNTLYGVFCINNTDISPIKFIDKTVRFYNEMHPQGFNLFQKILPKSSPSLTLEKIIDERVQTNDSIISKNFSHLVTNALLFIDVLAFRQYLIHGEIPDKYLKKIEETIVNIVTIALKVKSKKSQYDDLLIKLFEASIRYTKFSKVSVESLETLQLNYFTTDLEKYYLIDMAGMALWSDAKIENDEMYFLHTLGKILSIPDKFVEESVANTHDFIFNHKKEIPYFNYSNPVKHFYDQTTQSVVTLISRNKNRLIKEIMQSKELVVLLSYSTRRDLDEKEKKKVKKQLLEICKTVPSLAIFLLPGGTLLLPILIKFIPQLLPSAFNENLEDQ